MMKSKIIRKIIFYPLYIILVILCLYLFITSNLFLTKMLVPYVGHLMGADFIVKHATYDPFTSQIILHDATLGDKDNLFITAKSGSGYLDIPSLFKNRLILRDVYFDGMDVNLIKNEKGRWSLPWLYNKSSDDDDSSYLTMDFTNVNIVNLNINFKDYSSKASSVGEQASPRKIKYKKFSISTDVVDEIRKQSLTPTLTSLASSARGQKNFRPEQIKNIKTPYNVEFNNLTFKADHFKNGLLSSIKYKGSIYVKLGEAVCIDKGNISGLISVNLDAKSIPSHVKVSNIASDLSGNIGGSSVDDIESTFATDIKRQENDKNSYDIKLFKIRDSIDTDHESCFDANGTLNFIPFKLLLDIEAGPIRAPMLSIANSLLGKHNLGKTKLYYFGNIALSSGDFMSSGKLSLSDFTFTSSNYQLTDGVPLELFLGYKFHLDFNKKTVSINEWNSSLSADNENIFSSNLNKPFIFNYEKERLSYFKTFPIFSINSRNLELKLLNIFMHEKMRFFTGKFNSELTLSINPNNNDIIIKGNTDIKDLSLEINGLKPVKIDKNQKLNFIIKNYINFNIAGINNFIINNFKFTSKQPTVDTENAFILKEPFSFVFRDNIIIPDRDIKVEVSVSEFHLADIVEYIPKGFPVILHDGYLRYKYLFTVPTTFDFLKVKGLAELLYSSFSLYGKPINNLSISNNINAEIYDNNTLKLNSSVSELYVNGTQGLLAKTTGIFSMNENIDTNLVMSVEQINKFFFDLLCLDISDNIVEVKAAGKMFFDYSGSNKTSTMKGSFNLSEAVLGNNPVSMRKRAKITGGLKFNLIDTGEKFTIDSLNLQLLKENIKILKLDINGYFPLPVNSGKSKMAITSDSLAFDEVVNIVKELTATQTKTEDQTKTKVSSSKEFEPIDFQGLDLKCNIMFNNIFCGDLIKSTYYGKLDIKNNKTSLLNESLKINGTDIKFYGDIDTGYSDGYRYKVKTEFRNLDLNPLIKTFVPGEYNRTRGKVDEFYLAFQGKGFTLENLKKYFSGNLNIQLSDLSLPYQIGHYKLLYITLLPLEVLMQLRDMLPGGLVINNLKKGIESTQEIFENTDNINLASGEIRMTAKNGKVDLDKVNFVGTDEDSINYSNFSGTINYDGKIELKSDSDITSVRLPMNIHGSVEKPDVDYSTFIPKFIAINTVNILNPMNIVDLVVDVTTGVTNTLENAGEAIIRPFEEDDFEKEEEDGSNE